MPSDPQDTDMGTGMGRPFPVGAAGTGSHRVSEEQQVAFADEALAQEDWAAAREAWLALACAVPMNAHYRTQLMFARAGELIEAGDFPRAREELDRVLRAAPGHPGATQLMKKLPRFRGISRLLRRER